MASRALTQFIGTFQKGPAKVWMVVSFGATGAPTLKTWDGNARTYATAGAAGARGVKSITRTSQGLFVVTLQDPYNQILGVTGTFDCTTTAASPAAPSVAFRGSSSSVQNGITTSTGASFQLTTSVTTTLTDPASGEVGYFEITLSTSAAL